MKNLRIVFVLVLFFLFFVNSATAQTSERIISFDSLIQIQKDSSIVVTEEIKVVANGTQIRHGIYRDIPTVYRDNFFFAVHKPITIISVKKDGITEPYHTEQQGNDTRIYIGDANTLVSPGEYTYGITYKTHKQLGYFKDYDELYWNVTGNEWSFPIDTAAARIVFPPGVTSESVHAVGYVGQKGSKNTNVRISTPHFRSTGTDVLVETEAPLSAGEGLTIAANWPKGFVDMPSQSQNILSFLFDNLGSVISILLFIFTAVIYYLMWMKVGKDANVPPVTVVQFDPPKDMTPAQVRYIDQMGEFDNQCIVADLVHMAVNGYITIHENKTYHFVKRTNKSSKDLENEEKIIYETMFPKSVSLLTDSEETEVLAEFKNAKSKITNPLLQSVTGPVMSQLEDAIKNFAVEQDSPEQFTFKYSNNYRVRKLLTKTGEYFAEIGKRMIIGNGKYLWVGIIMLLAIIAVNIISLILTQQTQAFFFVFFSLFWNGIISIFIVVAITSLMTWFKTRQNRDLLSGIGLSIFLIPFVAVGAFTLYMAFGIFAGPSIMGTLFILIISYKALKRRSQDARLIQNHIDGFRLFLSKAQQRYIEKIQNDLPAKFNMYEKFLPYAIALNVEPQWSSQFRDTIEQMNKEGLQTTPRWYTGSHWASTGSAFAASSFASAFSSSIASASVNPSSSSGSGGGGSSGGGGGGGGGGGW